MTDYISVVEAAWDHQQAKIDDLCEVLESICSDDAFCGDDWGDRRNAWRETARAALAKARGEQQ